MSGQPTRAQRRQAQRNAAAKPLLLEIVPASKWPDLPVNHTRPSRVWCSMHWVVQEFTGEHEMVLARLSINRTGRSAETGTWHEDVTFDELSGLKAEVGYALYDAVEVHPDIRDFVNVAAMRHLWVLKEKLPFAWRNRPII